MRYSKVDIKKIHSQKQGKTGKIYIDFQGNRYIGLSNGYLRVVSENLKTIENEINNLSINVEEITLTDRQNQIINGFIFEQTTPATTWDVAHNLDKFPSIMVVDTGNNEVLGCTKYIDKNNIQITFGFPFTGKAYLT